MQVKPDLCHVQIQFPSSLLLFFPISLDFSELDKGKKSINTTWFQYVSLQNEQTLRN